MPPSTVKAKLLLGWMNRHEALSALNACVFEKHLSNKKAAVLWKHCRDKVAALEPRKLIPIPEQALTATEQALVDEHLKRLNSGPNVKFQPRVIKIHPGDLVARQFHVVTERSHQYRQQMEDDQTRINHCLGNGLASTGQAQPKQRMINRKIVAIDLPHFEFTLLPGGIVNGQIQCQVYEWDRYITAFNTNEGRMVLWGGYHRIHALLCQLAGDASGGAPLITVMTGMPDVVKFLADPSFVRDTVLGERPALLRDFLDEELFIEVNLRKKRAEGRVEMIRPGKFRVGILHVNDNT
jgi:hypothetical protein